MKRFVAGLCISVALAFCATAVAVKAGPYSGHTTDGRPVSFRVSGHRVRAFTFQARFACNNGTGFVTHATFRSLRIRRNRFSGAFANRQRSLATTIRGRFRGRTATGTIRRRARFNSARKLDRRGTLICEVKTRFTATR